MKKNLWMLAAILLCGVMTAQAAEVSDSLIQDSRANDAVYYKFNYPSVNADGEEVVLSALLVACHMRVRRIRDCHRVSEQAL